MGVPIDSILGGSLIGNLLNALCFGVLTIQTSSYYRAFKNDRRPLKLAVGFLWTLQAFQLGCGIQSSYWWTVTYYSNPLTLDHSAWEFTTFQVSSICASVTVQTFLVHCVYSLSANLYIGVFVQVLVFIQFGFGFVSSIKVIIISKSKVLENHGTWLYLAWISTQAIADIVITTCMCLILRHRRTGLQKTDSVLNHMVLYTISTGLVTSILACVLLVVIIYSIGYQHANGWDYSITMLTNLHMRTGLRARLDTPSPIELISLSIKKRMWWNVGDPGNRDCRLHQ
ncbi:hypothetical protein BS47DRAFT_190621 [Hydnum rufescens UP504]|uniref:DUF6534 domain-containing protein n=1 Tax=Hydnum rufescens UP504 TaxID=1448309 RepID=A0A9P6AP94_9AGAM|nr:hypothetical protein BS47DRAFT_190621 [Hydnum rufescens UP504]